LGIVRRLQLRWLARPLWAQPPYVGLVGRVPSNFGEPEDQVCLVHSNF